MTELSRPWYYRSINEPWLDQESGMVNIIIEGDTSTEIGEDAADYDSAELRLKASMKMSSFYGKRLPEDPPGDLIRDYHFFSRPGSRVILRYGFNAATLENSGNLHSNNAAAGSSLEDRDITHTVQLSTHKLQSQIKALDTMFSAYETKLKFFNGRVSPFFSFSQEFNRLNLLVDQLKEFIVFNGHKYREDEEDSIIVNFNSSYDIVFVEYITRGRTITLIKGAEYFLRDVEGMSSRTTNQILANLPDIYDLRKAPPTWSEFLTSYITGIEVDFYGPPSTPNVWQTVHVEMAGINRMFQNASDARREDAAIWNHGGQMINEAHGAYEQDTRKKLADISLKIKAAQDKAKLVEYYLNTFGFNFLIDAALECAAYQASLEGAHFPDVKAIWDSIIGIDPYAELPKFAWQLPKFPLELPVIGIMAPLTDEIKKALEDAVFNLLITFMKALADLIVELCKGFDDEYGEGPSLAAVAAQYPNYDDVGEGPPCLYDKYEKWGFSIELGNSFLDIVAESTTAAEACHLIMGGASTDLLKTIRNIIDDREELVDLRFIFNSTPDYNNLRNFFLQIGECINPEYCHSILNAPPVPIPGLDPCVVEERLTEALDPNILDELLSAYDNIDFSKPDLGCGAGIVPAFSNNPSLMNSIIRLLTTLFDNPKITFIGEVDGVKQAFVEIYPSDDTDMAYFAQVMDMHQQDVDPTEAQKESSKKINDVFGGLGLDSLLDNNLIGGIRNNVDNANAAGVARAMSTVDYKVAQEYKETLSEIARQEGGFFTSYEQWSAQDLQDQLRNLYFRVTMSESTGGNLYFSVGAPDWEIKLLPAGESFPSAAWLRDPEAAGGLDRNQLGGQFTFQTFFNLVPPDAGLNIFDEEGPLIDLSDAVKKHVYFPALLSVFSSMALAVANSKLFDYDEFSKLMLSPRPCVENNRISAGDLLDIQNIIDLSVKEFKENSCGENGAFCIIGPVEDAVIFGVTNAFLQIFLLEQLLKNLFFIDTYGIGQFIGNPEIINRIIGEIQESLESENIQASGFTEMGAAAMLSAIKNSSKMYIKKLLFLSESETSLEDPFGGPPIVISNPENPSFEESVAYLVRKRLYETIPAVSEVFEISGGDFKKTFLLKGIPRVPIIDRGVPTDTPITKFLRAGEENYRPLDDGIYTIRAKGQASDTNPIQSLVDLAFPRGLLGPGHRAVPEGGAFGVEEYVQFYFDQDVLENPDIQGDLGSSDPAERLKYFARVRVENLLNDTILPERNRRGSGNYVISTTLFEEFVRGLTQITGMYSESTVDLFEDMEVTYLFGNPRGDDRGNSTAKGPLTLDNIDSIRFWIDKVQKVSFIRNPEAVDGRNNMGGSSAQSSYYSYQGIWKNKDLGVVMQHPAYQKFFTTSQVGGSARPSPSGREWSDPTTWEAWNVFQDGLPYFGGDEEDFKEQFMPETDSASDYTTFKDIFEGPDGRTGGGPYTMLENYNTAKVLDAVEQYATAQGGEGSLSDWLAAANKKSYHNDWCDGSKTWTPYNNPDIWDDLWTNVHGDSDQGGKGRWRGEESLADFVGAEDHFGGHAWVLKEAYELVEDRGDVDNETYVRKQRAAYLDDLNYNNFSDMSFPDQTPQGDYNRINMLVYQTCNGAGSNGRGRFNHAFKYIYQIHPYDLYGGLPRQYITQKQWQNIRRGITGRGDLGSSAVGQETATGRPIGGSGISGLITSLRYERDQGNLPQAENSYGYGGPADSSVGRRLAWIGGTSLDPAGSFMGAVREDLTEADLTNDQLYDLLELYVRSKSGGRVREYGPGDAANPGSVANYGPYYPSSAEILRLARPWMGEENQTPTLINFNSVSAVKAIYVSDMERFRVLRNISSVELRALYEFYRSPGDDDNSVAPVAALELLNATVNNIRVGARVVYYSPPLAHSGHGDVALGPENLRDAVVEVITTANITSQKTNFYKNRKNFILQVGGGGPDWIENIDDNPPEYVVNIGTGVNEKVPLYATISDLINGTSQTIEAGLSAPSLAVIGQSYRKFRMDFNANRNSLYEAMANSPGFDMLFNKTINVTDLAAFIYLIGLNSADTVVDTYAGSPDPLSTSLRGGPRAPATRSEMISRIFKDTKQSLATVLNAALQGDDWRQGAGRTPADAARDAALGFATGAAGQFGQMGASFILKMLIETPLKILKGLAEIADPHVFFGKKIKDISGLVMQEAEEKSGGIVTAQMISDLLNEKLLNEFPLPGQANENLKNAFRPHATPLGIDLIGRLPYLIAVPPLPLGIIYILLNLAEMDLAPDIPSPDCSGLLNRPVDPDAPTEILPENPTTTYGCPDEEEN